MPGKQALNMQATHLLESWDVFARHAVLRCAAVQHCSTDFGVFVDVSRSEAHSYMLQARHYWTCWKQSSLTAAIAYLDSKALSVYRVSG